jgi:DNA-binding transcriptional regulator YhcF (GntR family)
MKTIETELLDYIVQFKKGNDGLSPSYRTMADQTDFSIGRIQRAIQLMIERGELKMGARQGLMVRGGEWTYE